MAPPAAKPSLDEVCAKLGAKSRAIKDVCDWAEARRPRVPRVLFARPRAAAARAARARRGRHRSSAPQARCGAVDGGRAGGELLAALFRTIKHDEAGGERAENVREAVMFALHEVLMKNDAVCAKVADLRDQVETLTDRCTEHFTRHIVKSQASRVIERRLVKSAENLTKVVRAWRQKFECFGSSDKLRMTHKILRQLGKEADKLEGERTRPEKRKADEAKAPAPKKPKADSPAAPLIPVPKDLLSREPPGDGPPAAAPALTPASIAAPPPEAAKPRAAWGGGASNAPAVAPGRGRRFDACRLVGDCCTWLRHPRHTVAVAFFFLHHFLKAARLEPRGSAPPAAAAALAAVDRARAAKPDMTPDDQVEVYVAHLADDEAAAVAMAAVHLAGKATDAPTRLSHVFEAVRSPQGGSMAKRCWPLAAPWRDQVLLAEQRLLRCLNYDVRTEKIKQVLAGLCAVMEDERYPTWAGTGAAAGMAPPVLGRDRLQISTSLRDAAADVLKSPAFLYSGLQSTQDPVALVAAAVLVANGSLDPHLRAVDGWLSEAGAVYDSGEKPLGAGVAQIMGATAELRRANDELKAYFTPDLQSNRKDAKADAWAVAAARCGAARRGAEATVSRLGDGDVARYAARALASAAKADDCAKLVAAGRDEVANLGRLRQLRAANADDCVVHVYFSDDEALRRAAPRGGELRSAFPHRPGDAATGRRLDAEAAAAGPPRFLPGDKFTHCAAEPADDAPPAPGAADAAAEARAPGGPPRDFRPCLHLAWPRDAVRGLALAPAAREDADKRTKRLAADLRKRGDQRPYGGAPPPPHPPPPFGAPFGAPPPPFGAPPGAFPPRGHAPPPRGAFPPPYHAPGPYGPGGPAPPPPPPRHGPRGFPPHHHPRPYDGGRNGGRDELGFPANRHANGAHDRGPRPDRESRDRRGRDRSRSRDRDRSRRKRSRSRDKRKRSRSRERRKRSRSRSRDRSRREPERASGPAAAALAKMEKLERPPAPAKAEQVDPFAPSERAPAPARAERAPDPFAPSARPDPFAPSARAPAPAKSERTSAAAPSRATAAPVKQSARASAVKAEQPAPESDDDVPISRLPARSSAAPAPAPDSDDDVPISALRAPAPATASPPRRGGKASKPDKGHVPAKKKPAGRKPSGRKRKAD